MVIHPCIALNRTNIKMYGSPIWEILAPVIFANQHFLAPGLKIYRRWGHMEPEQSPNMIRSYLGSAQVHPILHRNEEGNLLKLSFWQIIRARAFLICMQHHLETLYQNFKNLPLGWSLDSAGCTLYIYLEHRNKEAHLQFFFFSETG